MRKYEQINAIQKEFFFFFYKLKYIVKYSLDGINWKLADQGRLFTGNSDKEKDKVVKNSFNTPFSARCVQIYPTKWKGHIFSIWARYSLRVYYN